MARLAEEVARSATSDDEFDDLLDDDDLLDCDLDEQDFLDLANSFEAEDPSYVANSFGPADQAEVVSEDENEDEGEDAAGIDEVEEYVDDEAQAPLEELSRTDSPLGKTFYPNLPLFTPSTSAISYHIPASFLQKTLAVRYPKRYWSHTFYRGPGGEKVNVIYCKTRAESEAAAQLLLDEPVLGFDMEWRPQYSPGIKTNASLIQLSSQSLIVLFHIALHKGSNPDELMAPSLRLILESPQITKTGVAILSADGRRLRKYFKLISRGLFELSHLHNLVTYTVSNQPNKINKKMVSLANLTRHWLGGLEMHKGKVRTSDWSKELNQEQIEYAASDAYAGYMLFMTMDEKRRQLNPIPPLPAFAEEQKPMPSQVEDNAAGPEEVGESASKTKVHNTVKDVNFTRESMDPPTERLFSAFLKHHKSLEQAYQEAGETAPAYTTIRFAVLAAIAQALPQDLPSLKQIKGLGDVMIRRHGDSWLKIIRKHISQELYEKRTITTPTSKLRQPTTAGALSPSRIPVPTSQNTRQMSTSISSMSPDSKILLKALRSLRIRLATTLRIPVESVATDPLLANIASIRPRTAKDLEACLDSNLPAFLQACAKCGMGLLNFCKDYLPEEHGNVARKISRPAAEVLQELVNVPAVNRVLDVVDLTEDDDAFAASVVSERIRARKGADEHIRQVSVTGVKRKF